MKHRNSHFAVGYWSRIRHGRPTPDQCDIDPKALKRLLPFVFLLDVRTEGSVTYRLAGTTLCERYGGELRGRAGLTQQATAGLRVARPVGRQHLEGDVTMQSAVMGAVDDSHAAMSDLLDDVIVTAWHEDITDQPSG